MLNALQFLQFTFQNYVLLQYICTCCEENSKITEVGGADLILHFGSVRNLGSAGDLLGGNSNRLLSVGSGRGDDLDALLDFGADNFSLHHLVRPHAHLVKHILSLGLHLADLLHRPERELHSLTVVLHGAVSSLFKLESRVL